MHHFGHHTSSYATLNYRTPFYLQNHDKSSLSYSRPNKTNSSIESSSLKKTLNDLEMFPMGFSEVLKNEDKNIRLFKRKISKQKQRINEDISSFKIQFIHNLEDLRLSLHAELDRIYQGYLEKYANFKGEILEINRLKDELQIQMTAPVSLQKKKKKQSNQLSTSNAKTISNMENGNQQFKKYHLMNYVTDLQKERILPLKNFQRQLVILTEYDNGFYQSLEFQKILQQLKEKFNKDLSFIYQNKDQFIREVEDLTVKEEERILDEVQKDQVKEQRQVREQKQYKDKNFPSFTIQKQKTQFAGSPIIGDIAASKQSAIYEWVQNLKLTENRSIKALPDQILCGISIKDFLVFGGKSGKLYVHTKEGNQIGVLKEHTASICTLAIAKIKGTQYLASGSDHGCSSVIIWDVEKMRRIEKFQNHKAAVSAILDLKDHQHIMSGSYDKKLNIYNVESRKFEYTLPANKTEITGAVINKSGRKVVTCGLQDRNIHIWQVSRGRQNNVQTLFIEKKIPNENVICSIVASNQVDELVIGGTKDGKIKMFNIEKGQTSKILQCHNKHIIQLVLLERQSSPKNPIILAWPYKEQKILSIACDSGNIESKQSRTLLQFGCGISPKCFLTEKAKVLWTVSHSEKNNQIISYRLQDER